MRGTAARVTYGYGAVDMPATAVALSHAGIPGVVVGGRGNTAGGQTAVKTPRGAKTFPCMCWLRLHPGIRGYSARAFSQRHRQVSPAASPPPPSISGFPPLQSSFAIPLESTSPLPSLPLSAPSPALHFHPPPPFLQHLPLLTLQSSCRCPFLGAQQHWRQITAMTEAAHGNSS